MDIVAHRGWSARFPENTLPAIAAAWSLPVAGVECDVQVTIDGRAVLCHDPSFARFGGGRLPIARMTAAMACRADVGSWFPGSGMVHPPLLDDALALTPSGRFLWVELKAMRDARDPALVEAVVRAVRRCRAQTSVRFLCFDPRPLRLLEEAMPAVERVRNCAAPPRDPRRLSGMAWWDADHAQVTRADVVRAHAAGLRCSAYTVNTLAQIRRCRAWGLDALITNHPDRALMA